MISWYKHWKVENWGKFFFVFNKEGRGLISTYQVQEEWVHFANCYKNGDFAVGNEDERNQEALEQNEEQNEAEDQRIKLVLDPKEVFEDSGNKTEKKQKQMNAQTMENDAFYSQIGPSVP